MNEPLAVPGKVLQPGKYVMKLMDSPANRHIVQIYNEDESQLQTTVLAIPNQRLQPTGKTQFGFWEMPADQPKALRSWFYPGDNFGQEFAYPKDIAAQIAKTNNENVPAIVSGEDNLASAKVEPMTPQGNIEGENQTANNAAENNNTTMAQTQPPPDQSAATSSATSQSNTSSSTSSAAAEPAPAPAPSTAQTTPPPSTDMSQNTNQSSQTASTSHNRLPSTGSPFPLVGLGGLLSVGSAMLVRVAARKRSLK